MSALREASRSPAASARSGVGPTLRPPEPTSTFQVAAATSVGRYWTGTWHGTGTRAERGCSLRRSLQVQRDAMRVYVCTAGAGRPHAGRGAAGVLPVAFAGFTLPQPQDEPRRAPSLQQR